jgi:hypothetical protein
VLEAKRRLEAPELKTITEEDTACCYAVQDKVWIEDLDGNSWEVFVLKGDAPVMRSQPAMSSKNDASCCVPSCCVPSEPVDADAG